MHRRWNLKKMPCYHYCHVPLAYQPPASGTFLSEQTSHQQPASSTLLLKQTSTSHQPPAKRTGCILLETEKVHAILNFRGGYMKFFLKKRNMKFYRFS
jgi:hypothetical protein